MIERQKYSDEGFYITCDYCDQVGSVDYENENPDIVKQAAIKDGYKIISTLDGDKILCPDCFISYKESNLSFEDFNKNQ